MTWKAEYIGSLEELTSLYKLWSYQEESDKWNLYLWPNFYPQYGEMFYLVIKGDYPVA